MKAGVGPASLRTHYVRSQALSSSCMDETRLYFPDSLTARCLHRRWDDQQGGVVSLLLGLFNSVQGTYPPPAPSRDRLSQGGKGHLNHSLEVSLCKPGALHRDLLWLRQPCYSIPSLPQQVAINTYPIELRDGGGGGCLLCSNNFVAD